MTLFLGYPMSPLLKTLMSLNGCLREQPVRFYYDGSGTTTVEGNINDPQTNAQIAVLVEYDSIFGDDMKHAVIMPIILIYH